jgi:hypothetical protein
VTAAAESTPPVSTRALLCGAAVLLAMAVALQVARDRVWVPFQPASTLLWLHASPAARRLMLGYDALAADVYWIRTVVDYGSTRREADPAKRNYDRLFPLLEMVTTLDPDFTVAYRFGAIFLTEAYPNGPGRPDQAIDLLQRGIAHDPAGWEYMHDIGFVYYWWLGDNERAAQWFARAAAVSDAPGWLKPLAATTLAEGGERDLARQMWRQMRDGADVDGIRRSADLRLSQLDAMDRIDALTAAVARFEAAAGRRAQTWNDLVRAGALQGVPLDPAGVPFVLDPAGGVDVATTSPLAPLPSARTRGRR